MNELLTRLGVPPEVRVFFNVSDKLYFNYGDAQEHYGNGFHRVPSTKNLWVAGSRAASAVVITFSAMEAVAFLTVNRFRYAKPENLAFIAIGNRFDLQQAEWIRTNYSKRKFILAFGRELTGNMTDIKMAAGIKGIPVRLHHAGHQTTVQHRTGVFVFDDDKLTLSAWEKASGIRTAIRTRKPIKHITFLNELIHETNQ